MEGARAADEFFEVFANEAIREADGESCHDDQSAPVEAAKNQKEDSRDDECRPPDGPARECGHGGVERGMGGALVEGLKNGEVHTLGGGS